MPAVYGTILTAWSAGGIAGPQMVALIKDLYPAAIYPGKAATISFAIGACFLLLGLTFSFLLTVVSSRKSETG
jgi:OFA family oxalate/formate antiporter-like MFS transporter